MLNWLRSSKEKSEPVQAMSRAEPVSARELLFGRAAPAQPFAPEPAALSKPPVAKRPEPSVPPAPPPAPEPPPPPEPIAADPTPPAPVARPDDRRYRTPRDLTVSEAPFQRALVIGSCFSEILKIYIGVGFHGIEVDHITYNNAGQLPASPPNPLDSYDFQIIMLPLRTVLHEGHTMPLRYDDEAGHVALFEHAAETLRQMIHGALAYREQRPLITFVANYMPPQQNMVGRLMPRYDLRNPVYLTERLNQVMAAEIAGMANVHLLDIDQIACNFGRKYMQDDLIWLSNHGSLISDYDTPFDGHRLEATPGIGEQHDFRVSEFIAAVAEEVRAMYRTIRQADQVKLVIVDLDDTLWRGVVAEEGLDRPMVSEGWPIGFVEALMHLKKRGVLLAIASKNDEAKIRELWPHIYGGRMSLDDFVSVQINWQPKADNIERILAQTNLLAHSVVFIDDNPVERAQVAQAFPQMRLLGSNPYQLRRILLWSPETQVASITAESARRTEMVQAQVERETQRTRLTRAEFLDTLGVRLRLFDIRSPSNPRFVRALELINKTNQFNTTGKRWTLEECADAFAAGGALWAFEVDDRYTQYGVVGVAITRPGEIAQFVMSCRVIGLDVEIAALSAIIGQMHGAVIGRQVETAANLLSRDLYARCGFNEAEDGWQRNAGQQIAMPAHVRAVELPEAVAA